MPTYSTNIPSPSDGEPVSGAVAGRGEKALQDNIEYLLEMVRAIQSGHQLVGFSRPIDPALPVCAPVYYNESNSRYEGALAVATVDAGDVTVDPRSFCQGVVLENNGGVGTILYAGRHDGISVSAAVQSDDTAAAGVWYVSASEAGTITDTAPPVTIPVLQFDGASRVFVLPRWQEVRYVDDLDNLLESLDIVTSLQSASPALKVHVPGDDTTAATKGDLELTLDFGFLNGVATTEGTVCIRSYDAENGQFVRGPAVSGVYTEDPSVTLTSDNIRKLDPGDSGSPDVHEGRVKVAVNVTPSSVAPSILQLDGTTTEEVQNDISYYAWPAAVSSSIVLQFALPKPLPAGATTGKLNLRLTAGASGSVPTVTADYRRLTVASGQTASIPSSSTTLTLDSSKTLSTAYDFYDVESAGITVAAGDTIVVRVSRSASDGYAGEIGLIAAALLLEV